jgi:hypothetical protein
VQLYQRSCWLAGRDQHVTDLTLEHPSISKQHAGWSRMMPDTTIKANLAQ